jgi:transmembrane sensor
LRDEEEIKALFQKYLAHQCTKEECERLFKHLGSSEVEPITREMIRAQMESELEEPHADDDSTTEWQERNFAEIKGRMTPENAEPTKAVRIGHRAWYWQAAAVFTGLLLLTGWLYTQGIFGYKTITQQTAFGERRVITLPDHSTVTLNGNSSLTYPQDWQQEREVWLDGEAYFSVTHTADDRRFVVHTSEQLSVEVLGTEFNVSDRKSGMQVVLSQGSIRLNMKEKGRISNFLQAPTTLVMKPGERVKFTEQAGTYTKDWVEPSRFSAWKEQKISLDNTSLKEIALTLQETFGLSLQVTDPNLWQQKVSGSLSSESVPRILQQLEILFRVKITQQGQVITLHPIQ